jgi:hypothetical protein
MRVATSCGVVKRPVANPPMPAMTRSVAVSASTPVASATVWVLTAWGIRR